MRIIAGRWRGHTIQAPPGRDTRPTTDRVREAWMSALLPSLPDARVLDLFAGSGALGLETLSRGASHATFVERAAGALKALRANVEKLGAGTQTTIVRGDAISFVRGLGAEAFDVVLADPPYGQGYAEVLAQAFRHTPFARELWIEHRRDEPLAQLEGVRSRRYGDTMITTLTATE